MTDNDTPLDAIIEPPQPGGPVRQINPRPLLVRLFTDHNPFYLLSAACMLASCLALTNSLSWIPIATTRLFALIVTLNVYEAALLAVALFLITRRRLQRDGRMLLLLQAFFLADFSFLNAEIATTATVTHRAAILVNLALFVLAACKIGLVLRVLRPSFTLQQFAFVLAQLAILFGLPCFLRWHNAEHGTLGPRDFYAVWWLLALLPAAYELLARFDPRPAGVRSVLPAAQAAPTATYLALPYVSLLTHVCILHYVYDVRFYGAHAAPLLLGLTLVLNRFSPIALVPRRDLFILRLLLPLTAVLVSANNPFTLPVSLFARLPLSPLNLAVAGAFLTYVYCFLKPQALLFLSTGAGAAAAYVFGPSWQQVSNTSAKSWDWSANTAERLVPKTLADWGVIGLVASFGFLALGFWVSLSKRPPGTPDADAPGSPTPPPA